MAPKELARRNVDAAVRRFGDSRLVISIEAAADWPEAIISASERIRAEWKPNGEELFGRLEHRLEEYHGAPGEEPVSMDIVIWHMEHMLQEAFVIEMKRHQVDDAEAQREASDDAGEMERMMRHFDADCLMGIDTRALLLNR